MRWATSRRLKLCSPALSTGPRAWAQSESRRPSQNCQGDQAALSTLGALRPVHADPRLVLPRERTSAPPLAGSWQEAQATVPEAPRGPVAPLAPSLPTASGPEKRVSKKNCWPIAAAPASSAKRLAGFAGTAPMAYAARSARSAWVKSGGGEHAQHTATATRGNRKSSHAIGDLPGVRLVLDRGACQQLHKHLNIDMCEFGNVSCHPRAPPVCETHPRTLPRARPTAGCERGERPDPLLAIQRDHRIDAARATGGQVARQHPDGDHHA